MNIGLQLNEILMFFSCIDKHIFKQNLIIVIKAQSGEIFYDKQIKQIVIDLI
jgi:hypothetical protein